jgi:hypothetical protein
MAKTSKLTQIIVDVIHLADTIDRHDTQSNRSNLVKYFDNLSDDELIKLEAFMYFGRNLEKNIVGYREFIGHSRKDANQQLTDKAFSGVLSGYLNDALIKSAALDIDIEEQI